MKSKLTSQFYWLENNVTATFGVKLGCQSQDQETPECFRGP